MAGLVRGPITVNKSVKLRKNIPDPLSLMKRIPVAPSRPARARTAPKARAAKPVKPTTTKAPKEPDYAKLQRQAEQRASQAQAKADARARKTANNQARTSAQTEIDRYNADITANNAKRLTNEKSLSALTKLIGKGKGSHAAVRDNALATLSQNLQTKLAQLDRTFTESLGDFQTNLRDNEATEADASFSNLANRARERQDIVSQALNQGAGESDLLRSQIQALRNWSANQGDVNRSFFDTRSSVNSGITDLNMSTKTGRMNEELSTNAARGTSWSDYYDAMGNTLTDMANFDSNIYLLKAENSAIEKQKGTATGLVDWLKSGKNAEDYKPANSKTTKAAAPPKYKSPYADQAAKMAGSIYKDPGVSKATQNWQGGAESTGGLNTGELWNAPANTGVDGTKKPKRPEGATLRRW